MTKQYKDLEGQLHYHEAWADDSGNIVEHWGRVGERGSQREHGRPRLGE